MATSPARPDADEHAPSYTGYIARVPDGDLLVTLARQGEATRALLSTVTAEKAKFRYAPGKWRVTEVVGHVADAERIFSYRALRVARGDATPLPGFDENTYVPAGKFDERALADVLAELGAVRASTLALLRSFGDDAWLRRGTANHAPVSARALGYIIAGHELHHVNVLRQRYGVGAKP